MYFFEVNDVLKDRRDRLVFKHRGQEGLMNVGATPLLCMVAMESAMPVSSVGLN